MLTTDSIPLAASRGRAWFEALCGTTPASPTVPSILAGDAVIAGERVRFISVVPNPSSRFPRARKGEVGVEEGWMIARHGRDVIAENSDTKRPIVAIVDLPGQAFGQREEMMGIFLSCAAAADMYVAARLAGHPVVSLVVGQAVSGGFLAHGYQADRILALDDPGVSIHAMGQKAAARITRHSLAEWRGLSERILPMSYDIQACAKLGIVHELIKVSSASEPAPADIKHVRAKLAAAIGAAREEIHRANETVTKPLKHRRASFEVARRLAEQWDAPVA
ncbi:MAG: Malonate decarboxylase gamma subunit protein [Verrucomicrobia bacterium]|nr:Malonate decarboxylase gamma subunit protein [Verrucomicrobiota bacterium]